MSKRAFREHRLDRLRRYTTIAASSRWYPELLSDIECALESIGHYRHDAEELRREKANIWAEVLKKRRRERALRVASWSAVVVLWIAAIVSFALSVRDLRR